jgi:pyridoxamine 5'-phosphate oxidase
MGIAWGREPLKQFQSWFAEAKRAGLPKPEAMALATVGANGRPASRMVLLKGLDKQGFVFFGNYQSRKAADLEGRPFAALLFFWDPLNHQVRVEGRVAKVSAAESDEYFSSRPRGSQVGAWASPQSRPIRSRRELESRVAAVEKKYEGVSVPRPPHWGGWRLVPDRIEFWIGRQSRLHDRMVYTRTGKSWKKTILAP